MGRFKTHEERAAKQLRRQTEAKIAYQRQVDKTADRETQKIGNGAKKFAGAIRRALFGDSK